MKRQRFVSLLFVLPLAVAIPALASPPEEAPPEGAPEDEPTEAEALEDDILLVIDLPIAADEARAAGVADVEITAALVAAQAGEVSAGVMAEVLADEATETRANGKREAFGQWVKQQVASGLHGKELAAAIKERKAADKAAKLDDAAMDAELAKLKEKRKPRHAKLKALRKKLAEEGKPFVFVGKDKHEAWMKLVDERHNDARKQWREKHPGKDGPGHNGKKHGGPPGEMDKHGEPNEPGKDGTDGFPGGEDQKHDGKHPDKHDGKHDGSNDKGAPDKDPKHDKHGDKPGKGDEKGAK